MAAGAEQGLDFSAALAGLRAGLLALLLGGLVIGIMAYFWFAAASWSGRLALTVQICAALVAGLQAGRVAGASGLFHGLLAGFLLIVALAVWDAVMVALPSPIALLRSGSILIGISAAGGILGVNLTQRRT